MALQVQQKLSDSDWQSQKSLLETLWLQENRPLLGQNGVQEFMQRQHNFYAKKHQYELHFKKWRWSKNRTGDLWRALAPAIYARDRLGISTQVCIHGKLQSAAKIRKEIARYRTARPSALPPGVTLSSPPSFDMTAYWTIGLPYEVFQQNILGKLLAPDSQATGVQTSYDGSRGIDPTLIVSNIHQQEDVGGMSFTLPTDVDANSRINHVIPMPDTEDDAHARLESVMPLSFIHKPSSAQNGHDVVTIPIFHQQLLFSLANNFAGLGADALGRLVKLIGRQGLAMIWQLIRSTQSLSSRAIALNLFTVVIECGDANLADQILKDNIVARIDCNSHVCHVSGDWDAGDLDAGDLDAGGWFTPIERASRLGHKDLVKVLLYHGADVNKTYGKRYMGALENAFEGALGYNNRAEHVYGATGCELFAVLLEAGAKFRGWFARRIFQSGDWACASVLMSAQGHERHAEWNAAGHFITMFGTFDHSALLDALNIMREVGVDLNFEIGLKGDPCTILDVTARRGNLEILRLLVEAGARITKDTLRFAIQSCEQELVHFITRHGVDSETWHVEVKAARAEALAEALPDAIRLHDTNIAWHLVTNGALDSLNDSVHFSKALHAASEVGNTRLIRRLLQFRGNPPQRSLSRALEIAIENCHDRAARVLIQACHEAYSATETHETCDVDAVCPYGLSLHRALEKRDVALVNLLLEQGIDPNYCYDRGESGGSTRAIDDIITPPIVLAAEWGERSVIEALLRAGADVNDLPIPSSKIVEMMFGLPLTIACKRGDRLLVQLFLDAGADINHAYTSTEYQPFGPSTALQAAVHNGDLDLVRYLLTRGADPHDSGALADAVEHGQEMVSLLLERSCTCTNRDNAYAIDALVEAIKSEKESIFKMIVRTGVARNVSMRNIHKHEMTPLGFAIRCKRATFVEVLLDEGCSANSITCETYNDFWELSLSETALITAISVQNSSIIGILLERGADVNYPTTREVRRTPLQMAAEVGSLEIVQTLLDRGANVNASPAEIGGATALQLAAIGGFIPIACTLLNYAAEVDARAARVYGRTALDGAAESGRLDMVQLLLNAGAGAHGKDRKQLLRAIDYAEKNRHLAVCDLLKSHLSAIGQDYGADVTGDNERPFEPVLFDMDIFGTDSEESIDTSEAESEEDLI